MPPCPRSCHGAGWKRWHARRRARFHLRATRACIRALLAAQPPRRAPQIPPLLPRQPRYLGARAPALRRFVRVSPRYVPIRTPSRDQTGVMSRSTSGDVRAGARPFPLTVEIFFAAIFMPALSPCRLHPPLARLAVRPCNRGRRLKSARQSCPRLIPRPNLSAYVSQHSTPRRCPPYLLRTRLRQ